MSGLNYPRYSSPMRTPSGREISDAAMSSASRASSPASWYASPRDRAWSSEEAPTTLPVVPGLTSAALDRHAHMPFFDRVSSILCKNTDEWARTSGSVHVDTNFHQMKDIDVDIVGALESVEANEFDTRSFADAEPWLDEQSASKAAAAQALSTDADAAPAPAPAGRRPSGADARRRPSAGEAKTPEEHKETETPAPALETSRSFMFAENVDDVPLADPAPYDDEYASPKHKVDFYAAYDDDVDGERSWGFWGICCFAVRRYSPRPTKPCFPYPRCAWSSS